MNKLILNDAMRVLKNTSRTFYIPITFLNKELKQAVAVAYLAMRAIDEIEDHEELTPEIKNDLLLQVAALLRAPQFDRDQYDAYIAPYVAQLPEVTVRLADWLECCPEGARKNVSLATAEMAEGMAKWAIRGWKIETRDDLDDYTYYVAGLVGVMLSDLWEWHAGTKTNRDLAIGYGRGLQAVNILRNQHEDLAERGVSFVPVGWTRDDLFTYAEENLQKANLYMQDLNTRPIILFCRLPLALAHKTLRALKKGEVKMSRAEVEATVTEVQEDSWQMNN